MIVEPIMGTLAYQHLGIGLAICVTGISFLLSAITMASIPPDRIIDAGKTSIRPSLFREMADGVRYVVSRKVLLWLNLCFTAVGFGVGLIAPLGIFLITERLGLSAQDLQWTAIPYGLGEIIGGMVTFGLAKKISPQRLLKLGLLANAAGVFVSGISTTLWLTMMAQFLIALFQPAIFIGNNALVMMHTEQRFIGRVTGIRTPLMTGSMVVMMSVSGIIKDMLSLSIMYGLAGACFLVGFLLILPLGRTAQVGASAHRS
jgi:Na+/melibiose symporter-like transporter